MLGGNVALAHRRVVPWQVLPQVFGLDESGLSHVPELLHDVLARDVPCAVVVRGQRVYPPVVRCVRRNSNGLLVQVDVLVRHVWHAV